MESLHPQQTRGSWAKLFSEQEEVVSPRPRLLLAPSSRRAVHRKRRRSSCRETFEARTQGREKLYWYETVFRHETECSYIPNEQRIPSLSLRPRCYRKRQIATAACRTFAAACLRTTRRISRGLRRSTSSSVLRWQVFASCDGSA